MRKRIGLTVRITVAWIAFLVAILTTSCAQVLPLMGEGPPPGFTVGKIPIEYQGQRNPYSLEDRSALEAGQKLYAENCAYCHGIRGRGDGPRSPYLEPQPADFTAPSLQRAFRQYQDYVFWWVSDGVVQTAMPAYRDSLGETERWQVITYSWFLGEAGGR